MRSGWNRSNAEEENMAVKVEHFEKYMFESGEVYQVDSADWGAEYLATSIEFSLYPVRRANVD